MNRSIGYIGAGLMGGPMIKRLCSRGYHVRVFDIALERMNEARAAGAHLVGSPADAAIGVDFVALNLPAATAIEAVVFGPRGVDSSIRPPVAVVDFSTVEIEDVLNFAARLKQRTGCSWIDAPVSGGPIASGDGALTVMAGGDDPDVARLASFFSDISSNFTHVGKTGSGMAAKMVSQHIVGCLHVVLAEASVLADRCGIDPRIIPACVKGGHADGELMRQLFPRIANRDFAPRAYSRQLAKDLHILENLASRVGLDASMLHQAAIKYERLVEDGFAELDAAAVVKMYEPREMAPSNAGAAEEQPT